MDDIDPLRRAVALSADAVARGNHPFGALLADACGEVLLIAENTVVTERDVTGHAETNLVRLASRELSPAELASASLDTSCEPCAMCTGAHPENPTLALPARDVLATGTRDVEVVGPLVADEATVHHRGFWS